MTHAKTETRPLTGAGSPASAQVNWYSTFAFAERFAAGQDVQLANLPIAGTPAWCGLPDDDARKLLSLVLGGVREALNHDVEQEHRAAASREVSGSARWITEHNRFLSNRGRTYIRRESA
ncbi:hypothetical protein MMUR_05540 [Mycolicibacterium murale]|uniref:DUF2742 domain-containing protein n=1 Tax=Mycolicibacterium murale TaxID=182220 RepID=A0A7I9WGH2_9MYCO|nr:DUF2742 domain-containing protein [Mycolicibacterium murale]MCV7182868.1 DUF2742 domain-containing protein [Mycolicibacterium murale]GFG56418.1 hypothetical protein MMUR_05540 [Mycolicibacterium murale]